MLGEAIAADTWPDRDWLARSMKPERPYWVPGFFEAMEPWEQRMERIAGPGGLERLGADSLHYAMLMRKFQIEAYRREVPHGGYVVSVIRDFSTASMGLLDYADQPKWPASEWNWQGETMLLLRTDHDRRSVCRWRAAACRTAAEPNGRTGSWKMGNSRWHWFSREKGPRNCSASRRKRIEQKPGRWQNSRHWICRSPRCDEPRHLEIVARLKAATKTYENRWPIWVVPQARPISKIKSLAAPLALRRVFPRRRPNRPWARPEDRRGFGL